LNCGAREADKAGGAFTPEKPLAIDLDIMQALVQTIEVKDLCTASHTWRVVLYTRAVSERLGLGRAAIDRLSIGAALHDLGKIDIPDRVLQKSGPLTDDEYEVMKTHTVLGYDRLVGMGETDPIVLSMVRSHHERIDGAGYPDGLRGEAISSAARVFAVVDTFDAMTSVRPYRERVGRDAAIESIRQLRSEAHTHFCAAAVETLAACFDAGELDWIQLNFNDRVDVPAATHAAIERELAQRFREQAA
jgi:HD-GYP domain-containing protein (c-di-GMP phosphodiesterase class II)